MPSLPPLRCVHCGAVAPLLDGWCGCDLSRPRDKYGVLGSAERELALAAIPTAGQSLPRDAFAPHTPQTAAALARMDEAAAYEAIDEADARELARVDPKVWGDRKELADPFRAAIDRMASAESLGADALLAAAKYALECAQDDDLGEIADAVFLMVNDGELCAVSLAELIEANGEDSEVVEAARALQPGDSAQIGGGACPVVLLSRMDGASSTARINVASVAALLAAWQYDDTSAEDARAIGGALNVLERWLRDWPVK